MTRKEQIKRVSHLFSAALLCTAMVLASTAFASSPTVKGNSCAALDVQADVRPDAGGPPTKVTVGIRIMDLMGISDVSQTLTGDFAVMLTWTDPRLAHLQGCQIALDTIWSPGLVFFNSGEKSRERPREARIGPGGQVRYLQRWYGTFATYHNLRDFPFDKQTFQISLFSLYWPEKDLKLVVDELFTGWRELLNISNWSIDGVEGTTNRSYSEAQDDFFSRYDLNISAHRMTKFYMWKVMLPLCLIVFMSWCVFWISPAQFGPQVDLSATSMLTLIAFIFATTNMVPELGYLTRLDLFIVGSTILVFLALIETAVTVYQVSHERKEQVLRMDRACRLLFPLAFGILIVVVFLR